MLKQVRAHRGIRWIEYRKIDSLSAIAFLMAAFHAEKGPRGKMRRDPLPGNVVMGQGTIILS